MRLFRSLGLAAVLFATAVSGTAFAAARDDLNAFTRGLKGLDGQFTQQVYDARGKLKETATGTLALSAPRLFRWQYVSPYPQLIVADGTTVWIHEPDLNQVTRRPQGAEEQNSPLAALIDPARLDAQFVVRDAGASGGLNWLALTPKAGTEAGFSSARLGFGKQGLAKMEVIDVLGQRTDISFSAWRRNPQFGAGTFKFRPAKGVDVIGG